MFPTFHESYKDTHPHVLSKRRDQENSIAEFLERAQNENPKDVLLDLFYKKEMIEQANANKRLRTEDKFKSELEHDFDQKLIENNHLNYELFLNEHLQTIDPKDLKNSEAVINIDLINACFQEDSLDKILTNLLENGS